MESQQMVYPHGHGHDQQDPHKAHDSHLGAEGEDHHEKKSVPKKVKAKAKKIKDTITKHGHGHNHDHDHDYHHGDHIPDDHDLYEEDDEDDEMVEDPEVHGVPIYESTEVTVSSATAVNRPVPTFSRGVSETKESDPSMTFASGTESKVNLAGPKGLEEDPHAPKDTPYGYIPSNYQTKVTDPTGAGNEEIGVTSILRSFAETNIQDESEPKSQQNLTGIGYSSTGSHDQFSPETPDKPVITPQHPQTLVQENMDTEKPGTPRLTEKISSATCCIADKTVSAKNVVASELGYGEKDARGAHDQSSSAGESSGNKQSSAAEHGKKIAATVTEKLTPVYEKVAEAGTTVVSKMQGATETEERSTGQDRAVSVQNYLAEKLRPGEEDRALSEAISDALHKWRQEPETRPMGKVTESEELARRLGTGDKNTDEKEQSSYVNQAGEKSVVDKVKGTVCSWLGLGGDQPRTAQQHSSHSQGEVGDDMQGREERRLQRSSN